MKTYNSDVNTARMMANNGVDFFEDTNKHTAEWDARAGWCGFMPHKDGCIVSAVKIVDVNDNEAPTPTWVATSANLDNYIPAGMVGNATGYITEITLSSGACTIIRDTKTRG